MPTVRGMEARAIALHAETVRSVLALLGPRSRAHLSLLLLSLGLAEADVDAVLAHGLARGLFQVDPADPKMIRTAPPTG
jgi:hypothetical protein